MLAVFVTDSWGAAPVMGAALAIPVVLLVSWAFGKPVALLLEAGKLVCTPFCAGVRPTAAVTAGRVLPLLVLRGCLKRLGKVPAALLGGFAGTCDRGTGFVNGEVANLPPLCWSFLCLLLFTRDATPSFGIMLDTPWLVWALRCCANDKDIALPVPA